MVILLRWLQIKKDGFVVLEDFLTEKEVNELKTAGEKLAQETPTECRKCVFSTTQSQQVKPVYPFTFTDSALLV